MSDYKTLYERPLHPYTRSLLSAVPVAKVGNKKKRIILKGDVPSPIHKPEGCAFHERCPHCKEICRQVEPALKLQDNGHYVACHLYD